MTSPPKHRTEVMDLADQTFSGRICGTKKHVSEKINAGCRNVMFLLPSTVVQTFRSNSVWPIVVASKWS